LSGKLSQALKAIDSLDADALREALPVSAAARISQLEVFAEIDSTSAQLLRSAAPPPGRLSACLADYQHAGRGRRGRSWSVPPGAGLCLSVGWRFADTPAALAALPLAVGVVARRVLERSTGIAIALKWPNDLVWDGRKLGGILVDSVADSRGGCHVVIGVGVNVAVPAPLLETVSDWPRGAVDLSQATGGAPPRRVVLAAALLADLGDLLESFSSLGAAALVREFADADELDGRHVSVRQHDAEWTGIARGIEPDGALIVEMADGARRRVVAGDVSVRVAP
jgi:BirA family transcriptional regulator, biotin operon repressor / biotin---[acetyl-CoA-carboxylase] ligase